jgi:release factor glutamine methyltransferase
MSEVWTIRRVLAWATEDFRKRGLPSPRLDAELLAAHALGTSRVALYMDLERPLDDEERASLRALVGRRRAHEPVAYIVGYRDFYKHRFAVRSGVLVPRPETETLVEAALELLPKDAPSRALDLGVGSGIVGLSLLLERPQLTLVGVDVSDVALEVTSENAASLGVEARLDLRKGDLFAEVARDERFHVIVSNPPYIPRAEIEALAPDVREHEPRLALDGGEDGLALHTRIALEAASHLLSSGALLVEVGDHQADAVMTLHRETGAYATTQSRADLGAMARVVVSTVA